MKMEEIDNITQCFDKSGKKIPFIKWGRLLEDDEYKRVALTQIDQESYISTVWLGFNHNFMRFGPPIIFESMVFGGPFDGYQNRYTTENFAREGHKEAAKNLKSNKEPWR